MKKAVCLWLVSALTVLLTACGGGGGSAGTNVFGGGGGTTPGTSTYNVAVSVQRNNVAVTSISSTETVQAVATVTSGTGTPVGGVVVTFTETNASLLKFAPSSATALTDASGVAKIDISAAVTGSAGATTVNASADVSGTAVTGATSIDIQAGNVDQTVPTPAAINFVSVVPADKAIVIKGAGGNGRSESASLVFKVVDASNAPIKGANVNFSVNPAGKVTLNITSAVSDASGLVTTTVQSGVDPTSVVVVATATDAPLVTGQSDTLVVSNGVAVAQSFEIVAKKYNLDGRLTGDSTQVSAYILDSNGNPVPDGLAVSFTTDAGGIANSNMGACLTVNGTCNVDFRVQDPRLDGIATVIATINVGQNTNLSASIQINMSGATGGALVAGDANGNLVNSLVLTGACKQTFELTLSDSDKRRAPPAGTVIAFNSGSSGLAATVKSGSPVLDQLAQNFPPVPFTVEIDATGTDVRPVCNPAGAVAPGGFVTLSYTTPGGISYLGRFGLSYPQ